MGRTVVAYLGFGLALIGLEIGVGGSVPAYEAVGFLSAAAVIFAAIHYRPANRLGWLGIGAAQALFAIGDVIYQHGTSSFPGIPDVLYLTSYVVFVASLFALMGRSFPWRDWSGHVDTVLISACAALAVWMVYLDHRMTLSWSASGLVSLAYPVLDTVAITVMLRILLLPGRRNLSFWLLLASLLPLLVSDGSYVLPALNASYHLGSWLDAGWLGSYVLVGTAALIPSMQTIARTDPDRKPQMSPVRGVLAAGLGLILLRLADRYETVVRHHSDSGLLLAGSMVLVLAVLVRGVLFVRELDRARVQAEESERRFRMIFERAPIGISFGRDGIMSETNPALHRMLGYTAEEFANLHYLEVTHPDDGGLDVQAQLDTGTLDHFSVDKRYVKKGGGILHAHVNIALDHPDELGVSLIEDVTQNRELEEQLRQSQKMDAIGKLAGGIAHDFNNLMTAVLGYSDLVLGRLKVDDPNREKIEGIKDAAIRASDLTKQLLAFGRRQMLEVQDLDLRDVVLRSENLLRRLIGEDIRLDTVVANEPVIVHADATQLDQVVVNLAVNAREAMPDGGTVTIVVTVEEGEAILAVGDTGVGMDELTRSRIFEPFFTTKPFGEGSGLGLSTVDGIVAQSGGNIDVASAEGLGTVFTIRLPLVSVPATVPLTD